LRGRGFGGSGGGEGQKWVGVCVPRGEVEVRERGGSGGKACAGDQIVRGV
jgi:hypothetical protein